MNYVGSVNTFINQWIQYKMLSTFKKIWITLIIQTISMRKNCNPPSITEPPRPWRSQTNVFFAAAFYDQNWQTQTNGNHRRTHVCASILPNCLLGARVHTSVQMRRLARFAFITNHRQHARASGRECSRAMNEFIGGHKTHTHTHHAK